MSRRDLGFAIAAIASALVLVWAVLSDSPPPEPTRSEALQEARISEQQLQNGSPARGRFEYSSDPDQIALAGASLKNPPRGWEGFSRGAALNADGTREEPAEGLSTVYYTDSKQDERVLRAGLSPTPEQLALSIQRYERSNPQWQKMGESVAGVSFPSPYGEAVISPEGRVGAVYLRETKALVVIYARDPAVLKQALRGDLPLRLR